MSQTMPAYVADYLDAADPEDDNVITDVSRLQSSPENRQQLEKWKQQLRIKLIREQHEAQQKKTTRKPALQRLLKLS